MFPEPCFAFDSSSLWLLVALVRQVERQRWLEAVVREHIGLDPLEISRRGGSSHGGKRGRVGNVKYAFHGIGCCAKLADGTVVDVDFMDGGSADFVDPYFYVRTLDTLANPSETERYWRRPRPLETAFVAEVEELQRRGVLTQGWKFTLTYEGWALAGRVAALAERVNAEDPIGTREVAARLGDWERVLANCGDGQMRSQAAKRLQLARLRRSARLEKHCSRAALKALVLHDKDRAVEVVRQWLNNDTLDGNTSTALMLVEHWNDRSFEPELLSMLSRAVGEDVPRPWLRKATSELLEFWGVNHG